jgi:hypothetical protein
MGKSPGGSSKDNGDHTNSHGAFVLQDMKTPKTHLAILISLILLLVSETSRTGYAQPGDGFQEYQVKAAFLYNFAKFVEWPHGVFGKADDPIVIGIIGEDPFGTDLETTIQDKTAQNRLLYIKRSSTIDETKSCHILFICESEENRLAAYLKKISKMPILTISDIREFSKQGGMVTLVTEKEKVRFEVNLDAAQEAGLKISSQLLKLANIIRKEE